MTERLLPCPFCGLAASLRSATAICEAKVWCSNCSATVFGPSDDFATAAWNCRVLRWISVEERMPEDGASVLLLTASAHPELNGPPIKLGERAGDAWLHQVEANGYVAELYIDVTHWMPIPELPK